MECFFSECGSGGRRRARGPVHDGVRARRALAAVAILTWIFVAAPARAASIHLASGVLSYFSPDTIANVLTISLAGDTYTIEDPAEGTITLTSEAIGQGCGIVGPGAATCPAAAIASFSIDTGYGADNIVLTGAAHRAVVDAGDGDDTFVGGEAGDEFIWTPGDDSDRVDGGPGADRLTFQAGNGGENFTITADGTGFDLVRDVPVLTVMEAESIEMLILLTNGGTDTVTTTGLLETEQFILDDDGATLDALVFDAAGLCAFFAGDTIDVLGRQPVHHRGFGSTGVANQNCGAILDLTGSVLGYTASLEFVDNALDVALAGDVYTIHDGGEVVSITRNAQAAGCVTVDPNTVACPAASIASFNIATRYGADTIVLSGAVHPALVNAGDGDDTFVGGAADDVFSWTPGDDNDVVDGGPGTDTVEFNGSGANETITITAEGTGFDLVRDVASIRLDADATEVLRLLTGIGTDTVYTSPLLATTQYLVDGLDGLADTVLLDAGFLCAYQQGDTIQVDGRPSIHVTGFPQVQVANALCRPDPCAGASVTGGCRVNGIPDQPCQGADGDDVIVGTVNGDVIRGGGGHDRIRSGAGDDLVCGEEGDDAIAGSSGHDTLSGGPGQDKLRGGSDDDTLLGGDDDDKLVGSSGADDLDGGLGADRLRGSSDGDQLRGGDGWDMIDGGSADDLCMDTDQPGPFLRCEFP